MIVEFHWWYVPLGINVAGLCWAYMYERGRVNEGGALAVVVSCVVGLAVMAVGGV